MTESSAATTVHEEADIVITREFNAPRDVLWTAWTDAKYIEKWFGPRGFTTRVVRNEIEAGGTTDYIMIGPDGTEYPAKGVIKEIDPPSRIVSTDEFGEEYQEKNPSLDLPQGMIVTCLFDEVADRTRLTIRIAHKSQADRAKHEKMGVVAGWSSSLDKLEELLPEVEPKA
jgi:uncharacterized protein YndB with AHSA1/START domain